MRRFTVTGLVVCWVLLAASAWGAPLAEDLSPRQWITLIGLTLYASIVTTLRGPNWHRAYRLGRVVEREVSAELILAGRRDSSARQ